MCSRGTSELSCLLVQGSNQRERSYKCGAGAPQRGNRSCGVSGRDISQSKRQTASEASANAHCSVCSVQAYGNSPAGTRQKFTGRRILMMIPAERRSDGINQRPFPKWAIRPCYRPYARSARKAPRDFERPHLASSASHRHGRSALSQSTPPSFAWKGL